MNNISNSNSNDDNLILIEETQNIQEQQNTKYTNQLNFFFGLCNIICFIACIIIDVNIFVNNFFWLLLFIDCLYFIFYVILYHFIKGNKSYIISIILYLIEYIYHITFFCVKKYNNIDYTNELIDSFIFYCIAFTLNGIVLIYHVVSKS